MAQQFKDGISAADSMMPKLTPAEDAEKYMKYGGKSAEAEAVKSPAMPRRTIRDLDDYQSHILPDMTPQEFVEGMKSGKVNYRELQKKGDTALFENLGDAIMGELNMSPEDYGKLINENFAFHKTGNSYKWNDRYLDAWRKWNETGRPETDKGDWSWDFYTNYSPNGFLRWYRPQDQWGQVDRIHAQEEWNDKFNPNGDIHEGFDPYKAGYPMARESWDNFFKKYGTSIVNPAYKGILEWLDRNKEYFK